MEIKNCILVLFLVIATVFISGSSADEQFTPIECDLCQLSVDSLESLVKMDNLTYDDIYTALERICDTIPSNYSNLCNTFLKYSAPVIINQIISGNSSRSVCEELQICPTGAEYKICSFVRLAKLFDSPIIDCDSIVEFCSTSS
eukprot:gene8613-10603_t